MTTLTTSQKQTKKERILERFEQGITDVAKLADDADTTTSYVANVLQNKGGGEGTSALPAYFDLYTSTAKSMNVYARRFRGKMRFRDVEAATRSVRTLETAWVEFERERDRAGQHHAMVLAMIMANRARFSGKAAESAVFAEWLVSKLALPHPASEEQATRAANSDVELARAPAANSDTEHDHSSEG